MAPLPGPSAVSRDNSATTIAEEAAWLLSESPFAPIPVSLVERVRAAFPGLDAVEKLSQIIPGNIRIWRRSDGTPFLSRRPRALEAAARLFLQQVHVLLPPGTVVGAWNLYGMFAALFPKAARGQGKFEEDMASVHSDCCPRAKSGEFTVNSAGTATTAKTTTNETVGRTYILDRLHELMEPSIFRDVSDLLSAYRDKYGPLEPTLFTSSSNDTLENLVFDFVAKESASDHTKLKALKIAGTPFLKRPPMASELKLHLFVRKCHALFVRGTVVSAQQWQQAFDSVWPGKDRVARFAQLLYNAHRACCVNHANGYWTVLGHRTDESSAAGTVIAADPVAEPNDSDGEDSEGDRRGRSLSRSFSPNLHLECNSRVSSVQSRRARSPSLEPEPEAETDAEDLVAGSSLDQSTPRVVLPQNEFRIVHNFAELMRCALFRPLPDVLADYRTRFGASDLDAWLTKMGGLSDAKSLGKFFSKFARGGSKLPSLCYMDGQPFLTRPILRKERESLGVFHAMLHFLFPPGTKVTAKQYHEACLRAFPPPGFDLGLQAFIQMLGRSHAKCCPEDPAGTWTVRTNEVAQPRIRSSSALRGGLKRGGSVSRSRSPSPGKRLRVRSRSRSRDNNHESSDSSKQSNGQRNRLRARIAELLTGGIYMGLRPLLDLYLARYNSFVGYLDQPTNSSKDDLELILWNFVKDHGEPELSAVDLGGTRFIARPPTHLESRSHNFLALCHSLFAAGTIVTTEQYYSALLRSFSKEAAVGKENDFLKKLESWHRDCCRKEPDGTWTVRIHETAGKSAKKGLTLAEIRSLRAVKTSWAVNVEATAPVEANSDLALMEKHATAFVEKPRISAVAELEKWEAPTAVAAPSPAGSPIETGDDFVDSMDVVVDECRVPEPSIIGNDDVLPVAEPVDADRPPPPQDSTENLVMAPVQSERREHSPMVNVTDRRTSDTVLERTPTNLSSRRSPSPLDDKPGVSTVPESEDVKLAGAACSAPFVNPTENKPKFADRVDVEVDGPRDSELDKTVFAVPGTADPKSPSPPQRPTKIIAMVPNQSAGREHRAVVTVVERKTPDDKAARTAPAIRLQPKGTSLIKGTGDKTVHGNPPPRPAIEVVERQVPPTKPRQRPPVVVVERQDSKKPSSAPAKPISNFDVERSRKRNAPGATQGSPPKKSISLEELRRSRIPKVAATISVIERRGSAHLLSIEHGKPHLAAESVGRTGSDAPPVSKELERDVVEATAPARESLDANPASIPSVPMVLEGISATTMHRPLSLELSLQILRTLPARLELEDFDKVMAECLGLDY